MQPATPQDYQLVYDAVQAGFSPLRLVMPGIILGLVGLVVTIAALRAPARRIRIIAGVIGVAMMAYAGIWSTLVYRENVRAYDEIRNALATGNFTRVEGIVTDFQREPRGGRVPERWSVAGHTYELSSFRLPRTPLRPGIVKDGMWVRIADVNGQIARLEIRK